ncbi:hypothetical protein FQN60_001832, partial [Etheostoma spectabile]
QQQRKRLSRSNIPSSSSSSSSSVVSAGGSSPSAPEDALGPCCPESDHLSAPVVPSAAGQGSGAVGMMRRGTSLQSRRSKGSGSGSGDRDPLLKGSPQAPHRRHTHDPQQHIRRPRSSSPGETTPSSPTPGCTGGDVVLSSGYHSTEETDRSYGSDLTWDDRVGLRARHLCSFSPAAVMDDHQPLCGPLLALGRDDYLSRPSLSPVSTRQHSNVIQSSKETSQWEVPNITWSPEACSVPASLTSSSLLSSSLTTPGYWLCVDESICALFQQDPIARPDT